jgi:hypothetical protein
MTTKFFSICRRQSGGIGSCEVANFARNEKYFVVCTQAMRLLFVARGKELSTPNSLLERRVILKRQHVPRCQRRVDRANVKKSFLPAP